MLGRRVRFLRTAAGPRRLRRRRDRRRTALGLERQAGHGGHLVPRHRADIRRADPPAAPRRDRGALGRGRHLPKPRGSRRHPERRLPARLGPAARRRCEAVRAGMGTGGRRRRRRGRTTVRRGPAPAASEREPRRRVRRAHVSRAGRRGRHALARAPRPEDRRARVHGRRLAGRANRRPVVVDLATPDRRADRGAAPVRYQRHARRQPRRANSIDGTSSSSSMSLIASRTCRRPCVCSRR